MNNDLDHYVASGRSRTGPTSLQWKVTEEQAAIRDRLGQRQPPEATASESSALFSAGTEAGERREGERQTDKSEQRR